MITHINEIIDLATQAPSSHNTQPWKFKSGDDYIAIYPDLNRRLPIVDPDDHALYISLGCALENLLIAAKHFGYRTSVTYPSGVHEVILIDLASGGPLMQTELLEAIRKRQSTRSKYDGNPIPEEHLEKLAQASEQEDVTCQIITDRELISRITALVQEASIRQFQNKRFKEELTRWIRFNEKAAYSHMDGLRYACMGSPAVPNWLGELFMKYMATPNSEAEKAAKLTQSSSALLVFAARQSSKEAWVKLGQSFERVALQATALNIKHAHINMPCEEVAVREKLKQLLGFTSEEPLLLIRIGYSDTLPYSYRRPVAAVQT